MFEAMKRFIGKESGATAIEYALIASLIAVFLIAAFQTVGPRTNPVFGQIESGLK
jgi:pilus assembly protein Flp/PilA